MILDGILCERLINSIIEYVGLWRTSIILISAIFASIRLQSTSPDQSCPMWLRRKGMTERASEIQQLDFNINLHDSCRSVCWSKRKHVYYNWRAYSNTADWNCSWLRKGLCGKVPNTAVHTFEVHKIQRDVSPLCTFTQRLPRGIHREACCWDWESHRWSKSRKASMFQRSCLPIYIVVAPHEFSDRCVYNESRIKYMTKSLTRLPLEST